MNLKLSFVIPCYGSEKTIEHVVNDIILTVEGKNPYEIICVNDCSPDAVYSVLKKMALENSNVKVINLTKNFGQHNALMAGYRHCTGDIIISLDDDGQTDPKDCYKLINALNDDVDVVYAKYSVKKHSRFRNFGTEIAKVMSVTMLDWPKDIKCTSYWAVKRVIIDEIIRYPNAFTFTSGLIARTTKKIINVEIEHHEREYGSSGYTFGKLLNLWLNGFTSFSVKPLRLATLLGGVTATLGFFYAIYIIIKKILNPSMLIGYSSLMCVLLFIGGMVMIMLGLIGEYVGRIYICINKAPQYVIRNTINIENE